MNARGSYVFLERGHILKGLGNEIEFKYFDKKLQYIGTSTSF
jgi:hypothetical protein